MYVPASEPLLSRFQQRQLFFSSAPRRHSHFLGDTTFAVYATVGILRALALWWRCSRECIAGRLSSYLVWSCFPKLWNVLEKRAPDHASKIFRKDFGYLPLSCVMGVNKWHVAREGSLLCTPRTVSLALVTAGVESCSCGLRVLHGGPPAVHLSDTHLEERPGLRLYDSTTCIKFRTPMTHPKP